MPFGNNFFLRAIYSDAKSKKTLYLSLEGLMKCLTFQGILQIRHGYDSFSIFADGFFWGYMLLIQDSTAPILSVTSFFTFEATSLLILKLSIQCAKAKDCQKFRLELPMLVLRLEITKLMQWITTAMLLMRLPRVFFCQVSCGFLVLCIYAYREAKLESDVRLQISRISKKFFCATARRVILVQKR